MVVVMEQRGSTNGMVEFFLGGGGGMGSNTRCQGSTRLRL